MQSCVQSPVWNFAADFKGKKCIFSKKGFRALNQIFQLHWREAAQLNLYFPLRCGRKHRHTQKPPIQSNSCLKLKFKQFKLQNVVLTLVPSFQIWCSSHTITGSEVGKHHVKKQPTYRYMSKEGLWNFTVNSNHQNLWGYVMRVKCAERYLKAILFYDFFFIQTSMNR